MPGQRGAGGGTRRQVAAPPTARDQPRLPQRRRRSVRSRKSPFSFRLRSAHPPPTSSRRLSSTRRSACTSGYGTASLSNVRSRGVPALAKRNTLYAILLGLRSTSLLSLALLFCFVVVNKFFFVFFYRLSDFISLRRFLCVARLGWIVPAEALPIIYLLRHK